MSGHLHVSLEGSYDKIVRAREHVDSLNGEMDKFFEDDPCESVVTESDVKNGRHVAELTVKKEPPARWGTIVGEVGHNLRSALDQLVFQLATWNKSSPEEGRTQFPIFFNQADYFRRRGRRPSWRDTMLRGVSNKHRAMIDRLQPYQHGRLAERTALGLLAAFSNKDKHRVTLQPTLTMFGTRLHVVGPGHRSTEIYVPYQGATQVHRQDGNAHRMEYSFQTPPGVYVNMDGSALKVGIGFGETLLQLGDFYWITDGVEKVLQRFAPTIGL